MGPSLHSPPTGSNAQVSESQSTPTEAKRAGFAGPGKKLDCWSSLRRASVQGCERWGWARRALTSRARARTAINAPELERTAEALGAWLCTAAAPSRSARSPPAAAAGSASVPAHRPCRLRLETRRSPPWPANSAAPFPPQLQALTLERFSCSLVQVQKEPRRPRLATRGSQRPVAQGRAVPGSSRRGLPVCSGAWSGTAAGRKAGVSLGSALLGSFTLER